MKDMNSLVMMSRQDSDLFEQDIPVIEFEAEVVRSERSVELLRRRDDQPEVSMMDWTERIIEMTSTSDDLQTPQSSADPMPYLSLNMDVSGFDSITTEVNTSRESWQEETQHALESGGQLTRLYSSGVCDDLASTAGTDLQHGASTLISINNEIFETNSLSVTPIGSGSHNLTLNNNIPLNHCLSLEQCLASYIDHSPAVPQHEVFSSTEFSLQSPVTDYSHGIPSVTLLSDEENLICSNEANLLRNQGKDIKAHNSIFSNADITSQKTQPSYNVDRQILRNDLSNGRQMLTFHQTTVAEDTSRSTPQLKDDLNSFIFQMSIKGCQNSLVLKSLPEVMNSEMYTEMNQTTETKPEWEPALLSLTDMDIQSEIEVLEHQINDLNTPTELPKDVYKRDESMVNTGPSLGTDKHNIISHSPQTQRNDYLLSYYSNSKQYQKAIPQFNCNIPTVSQLCHTESLTSVNVHRTCKNVNSDTAIRSDMGSCCFQETNHSYKPFFSKPNLSEISSDALLSPGDVSVPFLGGSIERSPSLMRSANSDLSSTDLSSSVSSSVPEGSGVSSSVDTQEADSSRNLKNKLRSRLKAKGNTQRGQIASTSSFGQNGSASNNYLQTTLASAAKNSNSSKRKSDSECFTITTAKSTCVSSSSDFFDSDTSSDDDDELAVISHPEDGQKKRKQMEGLDEKTRLAKREKNRLAAQKCRHKKRDKIESLTRQVQRLEGRQDKMKEEVEKLSEEKEQLEEMLRVHHFVCRKGHKS